MFRTAGAPGDGTTRSSRLAGWRVGALAALAVTGAAAAAVVGISGAQAVVCSPPPGGEIGDAYLSAPPAGQVATDVSGTNQVSACSTGAGSQATVTRSDDNPGSTGNYVAGQACVQGVCRTVGRTGAEAGVVGFYTEPTGPRDEYIVPADGNTCVLVNETRNGPCGSGSFQVLNAWLSNADKPRTKLETTCVNVNGSCPVSVPTGAGVAAGSQTDDGWKSVGVRSSTDSSGYRVDTGAEVNYTCLEYNTSWDYSTGCR